MILKAEGRGPRGVERTEGERMRPNKANGGRYFGIFVFVLVLVLVFAFVVVLIHNCIFVIVVARPSNISSTSESLIPTYSTRCGH